MVPYAASSATTILAPASRGTDPRVSATVTRMQGVPDARSRARTGSQSAITSVYEIRRRTTNMHLTRPRSLTRRAGHSAFGRPAQSAPKHARSRRRAACVRAKMNDEPLFGVFAPDLLVGLGWRRRRPRPDLNKKSVGLRVVENRFLHGRNLRSQNAF